MFSIIIVTWNSKEELSNCLESLEELTNLPTKCETIIVDNGSEDGTREFLEASQSKFNRIGLRVIFNSKNVGLSRATEQAYQNATGNLILLCNPDIVFNHSVRVLLLYGLSHPEEIITAEMINMDGSPQNFHRRFPTLTRAFFDFGLIGSHIDAKFMNYFVRRNYTYQDDKLPPIIAIEQPGASFLLFGRDVVNKIGFIFDPVFPIWWNDVDLARRADKAGIRRMLLSDVKIRHILGHSQRKGLRSSHWYMFCRSMIIYARKWKMHPVLMQLLFSMDAILSVLVFTIVQGRRSGSVRVLKRSVSFAAVQMAAVLGA